MQRRRYIMRHKVHGRQKQVFKIIALASTCGIALGIAITSVISLSQITKSKANEVIICPVAEQQFSNDMSIVAPIILHPPASANTVFTRKAKPFQLKEQE